MSNLFFARTQFGVTTVYHFLYVPMTIGLAFLLALMETVYFRTGNETYKKMTQFWGKLFLINFAVGVVTGIMQEFQFGMNWSDYSRFVGDVFGAPLAVEALAAFFLESTFLGIWLFGWDKVSKGVHLLSIWLVFIGTTLSAFWILTANSFMQEPTGYAMRGGHAEMASFGALVTNMQQWFEFPHVLFAALTTGAFFITGVSAYQLIKKRAVNIFRTSFQVAAIVGVVASILTAVLGHDQAQHIVRAQPMKMAASEALWNTSPEHAPWTLFTVIDTNKKHNTAAIKIPYGLSILAYNQPTGKVQGMNQLQAQYEKKYGPGNYIPPVKTTFWSFRIMVLAGVLMILFSLYGLYLSIKGKLKEHPFFLKIMILSISLPFIANTTGWLMTEIGRQPWAVFGLLKTASGVSPTVTAGMVLTTLLGFALVYLLLIMTDIFLFVKVIKDGPDKENPDSDAADTTVPSL
ncbi:cytochrome ubiquinol oxidase subunit I [Alicyclobacillus sp. SO9]|uniref:cytochrome ubiquinol oxidase subunit I n=1 Tax=Alicyclobacillus sp. SO9 TaxID=2665646 RepID=UPI0018E887B5|nr:cytochrome ubiquinol oxidase subunit I [Alicyclobacillus sp. SO9]QQE77698.1 cytochrome ubiquinol oxidase subunit I [Alicyclobacillus sp. SO9]